MSGQSWTPAPKSGIIPLHPMTFGMILGRSFAALRHNPKVLFGFAVALQLVVTLAATAVMTVSLIFTFSRVDTLSPYSPGYEAIVAGAVAANVAIGIGVSLVTTVFTAMMQGIVAADIGYAALGEKPTLRTLWQRMKPAFWRLLAFSLLWVLLVSVLVAGAVAVLILSIGATGADAGAGIGLAILLIVLLALATIPPLVWLYTKLLLVPSILVLEGATLKTAFERSWRLTRRRFWVAFGVIFLINVIMGLAAQVVSFPGALIGTLFTGALSPTGDPTSSELIGFAAAFLLPQVLVVVIQAIGLVVQCTGATIVYLDSRMRYEGLDQTLSIAIERRDAGLPDDQLGDPFAVDPARAVTSTPPPAPVPTGAPQGYAPYGHPPAGPAPHGQPTPHGAPPRGAEPWAAQTHGPGYPGQRPTVPAPAPPQAPPLSDPVPPTPPAPPADRPRAPQPPNDSPWAAPGSS